MPLSHHVGAQSTFGKVEPGKSFFLDDVFTTDDTEKPISAGIFIYEKSEEDFECTSFLLCSLFSFFLYTPSFSVAFCI